MTFLLIILRQSLTMALYMAAGFALFKAGKISKAGSKDLATLLIWLVIPTVIIDSFRVPFSTEKLWEFGISALLGVLALTLAILLSRCLFPKAPVDHFAAAFSNAGFIGIPLVKQSLGDEAVFYLVGIITLLNIFQWSYGVAVLRGKKGTLRAKDLLCNPICIGWIVGFVLFVSGLGDKLPAVIGGAVSGISALNSPLAMLVLGVYLAQTQLKSLVTTPWLYVVSGVRLVLIPLVTLLAFWPLPVAPQIKLALLIAASAPVGANVAVYAQLYDKDYPYACQTVALSTLLSIPVLPLVAALAQRVFGG